MRSGDGGERARVRSGDGSERARPRSGGAGTGSAKAAAMGQRFPRTRNGSETKELAQRELHLADLWHTHSSNKPMYLTMTHIRSEFRVVLMFLCFLISK